ESLSPTKASILGQCRVIPLEYPQIVCRAIDLDLQDIAGSSADGENASLQRLLHEITLPIEKDASSFPTVFAVRNGRCWVPSYEPVRLPSNTVTSALLRQRGVYMITGGLGGIGLAVAETLARTVQARLVLIGRTGLPARDQWSALLQQSAPEQVGMI